MQMTENYEFSYHGIDIINNQRMKPLIADYDMRITWCVGHMTTHHQVKANSLAFTQNRHDFPRRKVMGNW